MKVALLGGSFNPVHNGHLKAAAMVLEFTGCKEAWFLPCHFHAFKKNQGFASEKARIEMLGLALKGKKGMKLSLFEIELGRKIKKETRTLETVRRIKECCPGNEFYWVIGSNLAMEIKKWKGFRELIRSIRFIVVPVEGGRPWRKEKWIKENNAILLPGSASVEGISSSRIRGMIAMGKGIAGLVPERVLAFIASETLYLPASGFRKKVYAAAAGIPKGRVSTYGEIARAAGSPKAARAVGNLMGKNPFSPIVPCHRVVKSKGEIGGFATGTAEKEKMLKSEGIRVKGHKIENFNKLTIKAEKLKKLKQGK